MAEEHDYLLYRFDENVPIGGLSLLDSEPDEKIIKYNYVYYKYDLGKKFILQSYNSIEEYFYETAKCFIYSMLAGSEIRCNFQRSLKIIDNKDALTIQDECSVVQKEHGYSALIIDWNLFMEYIKPYVYGIYSNASDLFFEDIQENKYSYDFQEKYLIIFFGEIKTPRFKISPETQEELKEIELKRTANRYNL